MGQDFALPRVLFVVERVKYTAHVIDVLIKVEGRIFGAGRKEIMSVRSWKKARGAAQAAVGVRIDMCACERRVCVCVCVCMCVCVHTLRS